jgi:hypothetical protein
MKRQIDIILISKRRNFLHNFKLSYPLLAIFLIGIVLITITTFGLSYYNIKQIYTKRELMSFEKENRELLKQLDSLNSQLKDCQDVFDLIISKDNRERTYLQLAYIHPDIWSMGIGGRGPDVPQDISKNVANFLDEIYNSVDILKGKYKIRSGSISELLSQIEKNNELWSHIPSINPLPGRRLGSGFGYRIDPFDKRTIRFHEGVDIGAPRGTPIYASADGIVSFAGWKRGYGWTLDIEHGFGFRSRYAHCNSLLVKPGDPVKRGQAIAHVGSTGRSTGPHLHYEVHVSGVKVNPANYIDRALVVVD